MENPRDLIFHPTTDGSPTLSFGENGEWMHHHAGAFSETLYVYGEAISRLLLMSPAPSFLCVGLGLGYMEALVAGYAERSGKPDCFFMRSHEGDRRLGECFLAHIQGGEIPEAFRAAYEVVFERTGLALDVPAARIRERLAGWVRTGHWEIAGALTAETSWERRFEGILYDAFSGQTSPELWAAEFLSSFLAAATASRCCFATYAATGELKRALERAGFQLEPRGGFAGKRESTLAFRL